MASHYLVGTDILGADVTAAGVPDRYVVIRIKNMAGLLKKEGGAAGSLALVLAPNTAAGLVYDEIKSRLEGEFKKAGVDAEVSIVASAPAGGIPVKGEFFTGVVAGAGALGLAGLLWWILKPLFFGRP